jgi:three-Cys-motif partner protein
MQLEPEAIGLWTEIKLQIIRDYAAAYTKILKEREWCRGYAYIDAFAGPGEFVAKQDRERTIPGSPINALDIEYKFTEYHFIDINPSKIDNLQNLIAGRPEAATVKLHLGDANEVLKRAILPNFQYDSFKRALCILDPYGLDIEWPTIESIGKTRTMDVFLNFPLMDINRNAALKLLEASNPKEGARLTKIWGDDSWKDLAYVEQSDLFSSAVLIKKGEGNEILKRGFRERLKQIAGFSFVPEPILMKNRIGGHLYFLFFASHQPVARNIAEYILQTWGGK